MCCFEVLYVAHVGGARFSRYHIILLLISRLPRRFKWTQQVHICITPSINDQMWDQERGPGTSKYTPYAKYL